ncbi:type VI secretion system baseplate subunit TssG [Luteibacter aegosomatis]|uniref:type VI secretion system baseplate subunit TssG n=1 Tax=Luteibacter aegosomatis TaxID=2911537 RepID=UPI001FF73EBF|nr:type VI secretion system baseplate subunit TssG [Luteibacter aegosomatis]UPG84797.1 type VI secretion system baseplate subunit TssG [Luteibacter aegosomatis]
MDGTIRHAPDPLALFDAVQADPGAYDWYDALRRAECAYPRHPRIGRSLRPADDAVRLAHAPSLGFASRTIDRVDRAGDTPRVHSLMLGLWGPHGALPLHLTEYTLERERSAQDRTFTAFVDTFHHRMLALFYRAWAESQPTVQMDRPHDDAFAGYLGAFVGIHAGALHDRDALPDDFRRFMAGRLVAQARPAEGLRAMVSAYFGLPVQLDEFSPGWLPLPDEGRLRMGGGMAGLGTTAVLGEAVRDAQHRIRIRVGPVGYADYRRFLPGGDALDVLGAIVRFYASDQVDWDLQVVLLRDEVPSVHLGRGARMGLSTWMGRYPGPGDAEDLVLNAFSAIAPNRSRTPS